MDDQMKMFEEGGLYQEGGTTDPVSGNEVPTGSLQEEVRDDIDAKLSEGEFVFPADVVRYIGLENLMKLRQKAKEGLSKMDDMGQMGNSEEAVVDDDEEYDAEVDELIDSFDPNAPDEMEFSKGGTVPDTPQAPQYNIPAGFQQPQYRAPTVPTYESLMGGTSPLPKYETRQYIGPNDDIISVTFLNGQPVNPIPEGYRPYKGELVAPKIQAPTVIEDRGGGSDDRGNEPPSTPRTIENDFGYKPVNTDIPALIGVVNPVLGVLATGAQNLNNVSAVNSARKYLGMKPLNFSELVKGTITGEYNDANFDYTISFDDETDMLKDAGLDVGDRIAVRDELVSRGLDPSSPTLGLSKEDIKTGNWKGLSISEEDRKIEEDARRGGWKPPVTDLSSPAGKGVSVSIESDGRSSFTQDTSGLGSRSPSYSPSSAADRRGETDRDTNTGGGGDGRDEGGGGYDEGLGWNKGGLLAPRVPRKPKAKQTTSTRGKGLARKK